MAYASSCDVAALTFNLTGGASDFSSSTSPNLTQVNSYLSAGCSLIESTIGQRGYGAIGATSQAYGMATQINALFGAYLAESSRTNSRVAPGERTRADAFRKAYLDMLDILKTLDLSRLGVSQSGQEYTGGVTVSDKEIRESNADAVQPRFSRGMFRNRSTIQPGPRTSAS